MVFYFEDIDPYIPILLKDFIIFILLTTVFILPYLIYTGQTKITFILSLMLAITQLIAMSINIIKHPL